MEKYNISKAIFSNENKSHYNFGLTEYLSYDLMSTEQAVQCARSLT